MRRNAPKVFAIYQRGIRSAHEKIAFPKRTLALIAVIVPLLALFVYVALRSVSCPYRLYWPQSRIRASHRHSSASEPLRLVTPTRLASGGTTIAGRVKRLDVHVGERVKAGQVLGEMDPVDLDERIRAQDAT
ncbi:MAG: biotin/lipoyl-binding protein [Nitrospirales bacterium]|nr:biotin/lipoyl-binding protein [Nitrospirales bacterium]